jgi:hypothetical protein
MCPDELTDSGLSLEEKKKIAYLRNALWIRRIETGDRRWVCFIDRSVAGASGPCLLS